MRRTLEQRFWAKVRKLEGAPSSPHVDTPCWEWVGGKTAEGYGRVKVFGRMRAATHIALLLEGVDVPSGMIVSHVCDNPSCVRPCHLRIETQADGMRDMVQKGRSAIGDRHGARLHPEKHAHGESHPSAKLNELDVRIIRHIGSDLSQRELARIAGVSPSAIRLILFRETWAHV